MAGDRIARAMARIDAATRRIELASRTPAHSADPEMEQRYRQLWTQASSALADIDRLIGTIEQ
jgi:hypothetical protein